MDDRRLYLPIANDVPSVVLPFNYNIELCADGRICVGNSDGKKTELGKNLSFHFSLAEVCH